MGSFRSQFGQLLPLPAQTLLFHESENKGCVRANLLRNKSKTPSRDDCLPQVFGSRQTPSSSCFSLLHSADPAASAQNATPALRKRSRTAGANHRLYPAKAGSRHNHGRRSWRCQRQLPLGQRFRRQPGQHADPRDTAFRYRTLQRPDEGSGFALAFRRG